MTVIYGLMLIFIVIVVINAIYAHFYKIVNIPSSPSTRTIIVQDIKCIKGDCAGLTIYDLGSGWGGLCRRLSKNFPNSHVQGFEISPVPYGISKIFSVFQTYRIQRANLFEMDLSNADILVCYLSHYHMNKLADKLKAECKKGTIIYSQGFPIKKMIAEKKFDIPLSIERKLYRYKI